MVEIYDSDREQVEELRKWWKENGRSIILGVLLGLSGVLGWRWWQGHQHAQAVLASIRYQQLAELTEGGDRQRAALIGEQVVHEHPRSLYAGLASLLLARLAVDGGDLDGAARHLDWVIANASLDALRPIAHLQKARVLLAQGRIDESLAAARADVPASFRGAFAEVQGDALAARGENGAAREAYEEALRGLPDGAPTRALIRMKLDDLGAAADAGRAGA